jgi:hypothetical protein
MAVAGYILACAIITLIATSLMRERAGVDISKEYGESDAVAPSRGPAPAPGHG